MPVVDAHIHIFPDEVVQQRVRFLERDAWFRQLYTSPRARLATAEELIASMDESGISISVACGFPWRDPGLCRYHNDYMCESARNYPGRIAWLAICSPVFVDSAARTLHDAFEAGASGAGELNADAQGFDLAESVQLQSVVEVCIVQNRPVMFHVSEPVGHDYPGKGTATPDRIVRLLAAFPDLRVVAAHWGGGLPFYELMPEVRNAAGNVIYDSAASTYLYDDRVFETVTTLVGSDRVMFASDFPVLRQGPLLEKCRRRPWSSDEERENVLGKTAISVYGLGEMV